MGDNDFYPVRTLFNQHSFVTSIEITGMGTQPGGHTLARYGGLAVYKPAVNSSDDKGTQNRVYLSGPNTYTNFAARTFTFSSPMLVSNTESLWWGIYNTIDSNYDIYYYWDQAGGQVDASYQFAPSTGPATPLSWTGTQYNYRPAATITYTANATPSQGTWKTPASPGGAVTATTTLEGYLPHPADDSAYDYSTSYDLQVYEAANPANIAINANYTTTSGEKTQGYFARSVTLTNGMTYAAKFRHYDRFNVASVWSAETTFTVGVAQDAPTPTAPLGKLNVLTGYNYTATHDPDATLNADRAHVEVYNSTGLTLLYTTETPSPGGYVLSPEVAAGGTVTVPEFHADLAADTDYRWRMRVRDTDDVWTGWSGLQTINTNAAPTAPTNLAPAGDLYSPSLVLTANVTDPDGDTITGAQAVVETEAGVATAGSPYAMTISGTAPNQVATVTIPGGDVTLGTRYRWRARATDGYSPGYGPYSADAYWHYQDVPEVSVVVADPQTVPAPTFTADYDHLSSLARTHKRIVLQKYANGAWSLTGGYDSGWVADAGAAGGTFTVSFPGNTVRNHNLYRLKVYARDSGGGEGETPYHEFETAYTGPPTLTVNVAQGVPEEAAIELVWEASTLTTLEFAGIEVQKATPGGEEDTETVALITDPASTGYTYHFPVSSRTYTLSVRQIENVGVEQVEGDWTDSTLSVDYSPFHFIKDAHDPSLFVAFETQASRLPAPQYEGLDAEFLTWGGEVVQLAGRRDYASGEVAMEFYEESAITESASERYRLAREILSSRRTLVILTQVPEADKVFVVRKGAYVKTWTPPRTRALSFSWREARYSEDYYVRNAATVTYTP
jgi:hypothetical protein